MQPTCPPHDRTQLPGSLQDLLRRDVLYYKGRVDMDGLEVLDLEDRKDRDLHVSVKNAFQLRCSATGESHLLCARKPEQKQRWLRAFAREREQVRLDQETGARPHPRAWWSGQPGQEGTSAAQGFPPGLQGTPGFSPRACVCWPGRGRGGCSRHTCMRTHTYVHAHTYTRACALHGAGPSAQLQGPGRVPFQHKRQGT